MMENCFGNVQIISKNVYEIIIHPIYHNAKLLQYRGMVSTSLCWTIASMYRIPKSYPRARAIQRQVHTQISRIIIMTFPDQLNSEILAYKYPIWMYIFYTEKTLHWELKQIKIKLYLVAWHKVPICGLNIL